MPRFKRLGLVYCPEGSQSWARQAAMLPTPLMLDEHRLRVYFASTDEKNVGRLGYVELDVREPRNVLEVAREPVLDIGRPGTFDDNGVNPSFVVRVGERLRMYYIGYQLHRQVPYTLFTGVAESTDGGETFERRSEVPILDRCDGELFFRTAPCVLPDGSGWRMWYIAGSGWTDLGGRTQPIYGLHTITSADGLHFVGPGQKLLEPQLPVEIGFGRPFIRAGTRGAEMFYSTRRPTGYGLGYAQSPDCQVWTRRDAELHFEGVPEPWESEMMCYSAIVETRSATLMLYNGNGYGRTGFGVAVMEPS